MTQDILTALLVNAAVFSVLFGLMMLLRALLKKHISAVLQYVLWTVVLVKLVLPFGFESSLSPFGFFEKASASPIVAAQVSNTDAAPRTTANNVTQPQYTTGMTAASSQVERDAADVVQQEAVQGTTPAVMNTATAQPLSWMDWALIVWAMGALTVGMMQALGARNLRKRALHARLALPERFEGISAACARELGMKRRVCVVLQSTLNTPVAMGVVRPLLVLPEDVRQRSDEQLRHICLHEMTHIRHGDLAVIALMGLLRAVYWFNPLTWLCLGLVRRDMETACDARVLQHIGEEARKHYIGTVLHFAGREQETRLMAAMGMADARMPMEQRIRSMFRRTRTGRRTKAGASCLAALMLAVSVLTACQPTPEQPVVAGKNDGVLESALGATPAAEATTYEAPDHLALDIDVPIDNYSILFDADVVVPDQTAYPVYTVQQARFTQEQADALRLALLGDKTLYKQGDYRSREEIQRSINSYEEQLQWAVEEGYQGLVDSYTEILKGLYAEYAATPENLTYEEADTTLQFHEEYAEPWLYGGTEIITEDGGMRYEWTDEARAKATAAGCSSVGGVCWMDSGRKMEFRIINDEHSSGAYLTCAEGNAIWQQCDTCTLEQAIQQGDAILAAAGLDFSLVNAETQTQTLDDNGNEVPEYAWSHTLVYKRNVPGVVVDNITSAVQSTQGLAGEPGYNGLVPYQEAITIIIDDLGVVAFNWSEPIEVTATESANVPLISFDEISSRIASQIKIQTMWDEEEYGSEWIESRRLEITKIVLSYLVVAKANDLSSFYYIPVWNVCGNLYYRYKDEYAATCGYVLDENNERNATLQYRGDTSDHSLLTISAIDGTVIPREMHT